MQKPAARIPEELAVGRGDPVYMAHAYLTKVPVPAILPFIAAYSPPGGTVGDPFAGSGMTGVAAAMLGRAARLSDISVLGRHIGSNYVNLVDGDALAKHAELVVDAARRRIGDVYATPCSSCGERGQLVKAVWSYNVLCAGCRNGVNFYRALETAAWDKQGMKCPHCGTRVTSKDARVGEEAVLDYIACPCEQTQVEQSPTRAVDVQLHGLFVPDVGISADRQMYQASALGKSGHVTVASYYSPRNLAALAALFDAIRAVDDVAVRSKLMFVFTACLTRGSKRYQWSRQRPLNAANANYYVAPVFYEWNVYDLFLRKVTSARRADAFVREERRKHVAADDIDAPDVTYTTATASSLPLPDASLDYVFTDPPFGSNLFYADMALFQEGWLQAFTDESEEAVIDRRGTRSADRYERMLTNALRECVRVLRPGGHVSMVFGNSSGKVWALVQRAIAAAGLAVVPEALVILNKGQRSVKGLASGFEHVATLDLVITMRVATDNPPAPVHPTEEEAQATVRQLAAETTAASPSHLYLELLRTALRRAWSLADLDLRSVTTALQDDGWLVDERSGLLIRNDTQPGA